MATTIITLTNGSYSYENESIRANGGMTINGKLIQRIDGSVTDDLVVIGSFNANRDMPESQGNLRFNISFTDPTKAVTLLNAAQDAVVAVQAKLDE